MKGVIEEVVYMKGFIIVEEVKYCIKVFGFCGGCKLFVEDFLRYMISSEYIEFVGIFLFCGCIDFIEDDIIVEF